MDSVILVYTDDCREVLVYNNTYTDNNNYNNIITLTNTAVIVFPKMCIVRKLPNKKQPNFLPVKILYRTPSGPKKVNG